MAVRRNIPLDDAEEECKARVTRAIDIGKFAVSESAKHVTKKAVLATNVHQLCINLVQCGDKVVRRKQGRKRGPEALKRSSCRLL
jgi:hypothetical protein